MYGEYSNTAVKVEKRLESSPRVRGIPSKEDPLVVLLRVIPACTGNTMVICFAMCLISSHPRVYGEYTYWLG